MVERGITGLLRKQLEVARTAGLGPEQATDSHHVDIRADLYSLGCTFFYLLAGRPPFPGGEALAKLMKHRFDPPPPITALRPDAPR